MNFPPHHLFCDSALHHYYVHVFDNQHVTIGRCIYVGTYIQTLIAVG